MENIFQNMGLFNMQILQPCAQFSTHLADHWVKQYLVNAIATADLKRGKKKSKYLQQP